MKRKKNFYLAVYMLAFLAAMPFLSAQPRIVGIGDSTMYQYDETRYSGTNEMRGWLQMFPAYLKGEVRVDNESRAGRSSKSFYYERWNTVKESLNPGDYLLIQFGHNDEKNDGLDSEGGEGKKEEEIRGTAPWGQYREFLTKYVEESRAKGVVPVFLTPVVRAKMDEEGKIIPEGVHNLSHICGNDSLMNYPVAMRKLAEELEVPLIDMTRLTQELVEEYGYQKAKKFIFCNKDDTHLRATGALLFGKLAMEEMIRQNVLTEAFISVE